MASFSFARLLESTGLEPYRAQLVDNGFDDVAALCDMSEQDMAMFAVPVAQRPALRALFSSVRSSIATGSGTLTNSALGFTPEEELISLSNGGTFGMAMDLDTMALPPEAGGDYLTGMSVNSSIPNADVWLLGSEMLVPASTWTRLTTDTGVVQRLLALYFCWEHPIFTSLSKHHFVRDFCEGRARYSSPLLVNALLSLGYCWSSQNIDGTSPHGAYPSGDAFFEEALRLFDAEESHHSLTTIQALSIMSIRETSCGRDSQSYHYAGQCMRLAIEMGTHHIDGALGDEESVVTAMTFWGAFALDQ